MHANSGQIRYEGVPESMEIGNTARRILIGYPSRLQVLAQHLGQLIGHIREHQFIVSTAFYVASEGFCQLRRNRLPVFPSMLAVACRNATVTR